MPQQFIPECRTAVIPRVEASAIPRVETVAAPRVHFDEAVPRRQIYNGNPRIPMDHPWVDQQLPMPLTVKPAVPAQLIVKSPDMQTQHRVPPIVEESSIADRVK